MCLCNAMLTLDGASVTVGRSKGAVSALQETLIVYFFIPGQVIHLK